MLSINELKRYNPVYDEDFYNGIKDEDLKIINHQIEMLNKINRSTPQIGDIVTVVCGDIRARCHLESLSSDRGGNLCVNCDYSHISYIKDSKYYCQASGGPWVHADPNEFKYLGITTRLFWSWGRHGVGPGNGIVFPAVVSLWQVEIKDAYLG